MPGGMVCPQCFRQLPRTEQAAMRGNSTEMVLWGEVKSKGAARRVMHLEQAAAFLFYEKDTPLQQLIHRMKYADQPEIAYRLGREAAMEFMYSDFFEGVDYILPVPLHPKRYRSRGYNQSEYIARGIADATGIPVDTTHVTRVKDTPQQALQDAEGRKTNVAKLIPATPPPIIKKSYFLVMLTV